MDKLLKIIFIQDSDEHLKGEIHEVYNNSEDRYYRIKEEQDAFDSHKTNIVTGYRYDSPDIMLYDKWLAEWREEQIKSIIDD